jgi:SNF2 family DNA or RNA helicase
MSAVKIALLGDRIAVKISFAGSYESDIESVQELGATFRKTGSVWMLPLQLEKCIDLRHTFGDRLVISQSLAKWAWEERNKREALELLRAGDLDDTALLNLKSLAPGLWDAVTSRPYQAAGAAFAVTGRNVLLGDQPGLGKTYMGLAAIVESKAKRVLVVAPRTAVRTVWESHIKRLCPFMTAVVAQGPRANREAAIAEFNSRSDSFKSMKTNYVAALVVNQEMIRVKRMWRCDHEKLAINGTSLSGMEYPKPPGKKGGCPAGDAHEHTILYYPEYPELFGRPWDFIVMDECHHALASRYNVQSANITQIRLGAMRLPMSKDGYKLGMSATPYRSKAQKAWGTLNWLQPKTFSSFWRWADELFAVSEGRYAKEVSQKPRNPEEFRDRMRPYLLARTKAEVAPELPPIEYAGTTPNGEADGPVGVWLDLDPVQAKAYAQMVAMAEAELHNGRLTATGVLAELMRLKQFACSYGESVGRNAMEPALPSNKYDWMLNFMQEREGFAGKVIVASQFTSLLRMFANSLYRDMTFTHDDMPLILHGGTTDHGREIFQERIQDPNDPAWIGFINMKAGGEAITLDQADDMILLDLPWTDDEIQQVENRLHRISRIHQVTVYRLGSLNTVDQRIASLTDEQRADLMALRPAGRKILTGLLEI